MLTLPAGRRLVAGLPYTRVSLIRRIKGALTSKGGQTAVPPPSIAARCADLRQARSDTVGYQHTDGRRSLTWQVIGAQNSDDLYIAARGMMSQTKLSLHQSGVWRYAFTKPFAAKQRRWESGSRISTPNSSVARPGWLVAASPPVHLGQQRRSCPLRDRCVTRSQDQLPHPARVRVPGHVDQSGERLARQRGDCQSIELTAQASDHC